MQEGSLGFLRNLTDLASKTKRGATTSKVVSQILSMIGVKVTVEKDSLEYMQSNYESGMAIVSNVMYCLKYSLSSADFVRLNDKDELVNDRSAKKNDGAE